MPYAVENALYQWLEGERRVREAGGLDVTVEQLVEELRKRLGGSFDLPELADLYANDTDWALDLASRRAPSSQPSHVVDAAFARYAREARDYAGGVSRPRAPRPDA